MNINRAMCECTLPILSNIEAGSDMVCPVIAVFKRKEKVQIA